MSDIAIMTATCRKCGKVEYWRAKGVDALVDLAKKSGGVLSEGAHGETKWLCDECAPLENKQRAAA